MSLYISFTVLKTSIPFFVPQNISETSLTHWSFKNTYLLKNDCFFLKNNIKFT